ncbi:unnamed protein product [Fraxinus pennsylvanica]|uniref:Amino acid transporter transmembrane domain-containing protein n=1 Tax=Fraxinus pennsylvanica TaxID=56036 RepID=A0AAD1ZX77_9LAMI|nr:unnamed protein product [Fraxinus pennsylvanica]
MSSGSVNDTQSHLICRLGVYMKLQASHIEKNPNRNFGDVIVKFLRIFLEDTAHYISDIFLKLFVYQKSHCRKSKASRSVSTFIYVYNHSRKSWDSVQFRAMGTQAFTPDYSNEVDERDAREKAIDEWLPITSSRDAKWWYSAFHNVTAIVGAGVLGFPYVMAQLGWGPGVGSLVISWIITLYTLWQMVEKHEIIPGKRFDRYHELGQHAFGEKLGLYIVIPQQLMVEAGIDIVYMVTGGECLQRFHDLVCKDCKKIKLTYFIMIFASVQFVLCQLPNFNAIYGVSLVAAVMSLSYSTIAWGASLNEGVQPDVQYGYNATTTAGIFFNFFNSLGSVAFAYAGHNVVMEIQATMPSTPEKPSKGPMWRGVIAAYVAIAFCYFPVALIGYWIFGNKVDENIFRSLEKPVWLIAMANLFVVVHLIGGYQIYAMPVFDMIEYALVKILKFKPSWMLRIVSRNIYVAFTMVVGITIPFFNGLLGFFGGFAFASTTYFLPCIIWLAIYKPRKFSLSWFTNWICIVLGVILMIVASIGGLRQIIVQAKGIISCAIREKKDHNIFIYREATLLFQQLIGVAFVSSLLILKGHHTANSDLSKITSFNSQTVANFYPTAMVKAFTNVQLNTKALVIDRREHYTWSDEMSRAVALDTLASNVDFHAFSQSYHANACLKSILLITPLIFLLAIALYKISLFDSCPNSI